MKIPSLLLKQLYVFGSLENHLSGIRFKLKNRISDARIIQVNRLTIGGKAVALDTIQIDGKLAVQNDPIAFGLGEEVELSVESAPLPAGSYLIDLSIQCTPFGDISIKVNGSIQAKDTSLPTIPRDAQNDYSPQIVQTRQDFVSDFSGASLTHLSQIHFDHEAVRGNCEHFTGLAQIPLGIAGPIRINGEFAQGDFLIPLATTEGTLVASYNRGMKLLNACGGVRCTVLDDAMQRAPVFVMEDARAARHLIQWVQAHFDEIAAQAEATTSIGKLSYIDPYSASKMAFLRFNFTTGDAAGQNMVGRATFSACSWILDQYKAHPIQHFYLESNLATDKKASQVNVMHTRGKRVTAEVTIPKALLAQYMRVDSRSVAYHCSVGNVGAILSGANNNGLHSANAITAMFIATGQDVANVSESSAGILYTELLKNDDLYFSITIPSLIVATYGGGTGLPTQRECLEIMGCFGAGKVKKLAEIVAGTVLAGELSLVSAISSSDWVSSHEHYGRNR